MANLSAPSPGKWILDMFGKNMFKPFFDFFFCLDCVIECCQYMPVSNNKCGQHKLYSRSILNISEYFIPKQNDAGPGPTRRADRPQPTRRAPPPAPRPPPAGGPKMSEFRVPKFPKIVKKYFSPKCPKSISLDSGHLDEPFGSLIFD